MFLKIILFIIILFIIKRTNEPMKCKEVYIKDPPIASIYDVSYNLETGQFVNTIFDTQYKEYNILLKEYYNNLKTYCYLN